MIFSRKILFGVHSTISKDAVFCSSVVKASTVVSSLSAIRTSLLIVECTPKIIFREKIKEFGSSSQMNLSKSVPVKTPDLASFRDLNFNIDNITDQRSGGIATRIADKDRIWRPKPSDIETAATHDDIKNISEKLVFSKYHKELDFETIKMLEREHKERENIKEIDTRLRMTRLDEQKMKNIEERKNIDDIPTQIEMIRSEHSSTSKCVKHVPKVDSDPDPPPSDLSYSSSSSDLKRKRNKSKKKKMNLMTLIHLRTVIIDVDDTKIRIIRKRIRSDYAQL